MKEKLYREFLKKSESIKSDRIWRCFLNGKKKQRKKMKKIGQKTKIKKRVK